MGTTNARLSPWCLEEMSSLRSQEGVRLGLRGAKYVRVRGLGMAAVSGGVEHEHGHMGGHCFNRMLPQSDRVQARRSCAERGDLSFCLIQAHPYRTLVYLQGNIPSSHIVYNERDVF